MKAKIKYLTIAVAVLLSVFSGCTKEDSENEKETKSKSLFLKIDHGVATYSESPSVNTGTSVILSSGNLYFVNASGTIVRHYALTDKDSENNNINIKEIEKGKLLQDLPGSITHVYIAGNTPNLPTSGNIAAVKAAIIKVEAQKEMEAINLYGSNALKAPEAPDKPYTCTIELNPTLARVELADITARGAITSFEVEGIFIDNYHSQASVDGTLDVANLKSNGSDVSAFNNETSAYPTELNQAVYNFYTVALASENNIVKLKDEKKVWGYNLFASTAGSDVPRIVIRLKNIKTNNGTEIANPQFITIKGLVNGLEPITGIKPGEVYSIGAGALAFDETQLAPVPNQKTIDVNVSITLATWKTISVTPEI